MSRLVIQAGRVEKNYWSDLWRYRELFAILAWRDVTIRYKQTVIGFSWTLLQPFLTMVVMTVIFSKVAGLPSEAHAPYAIMVFAAMLPWNFFANSLTTASQSIVGNANLISKVYFPRVIVPASAVVVACVDFLISFAILAALMLWYQFPPTPKLLILPVFVAFAFLASLGPGLLICALNVKYRDFRYVLPFIVQFGFFVSPVALSSSLIREKLGDTAFAFYSLNPMVGVIDGFRWAILGSPWNSQSFLIALVISPLLLLAGVAYFRRTERAFADII